MGDNVFAPDMDRFDAAVRNEPLPNVAMKLDQLDDSVTRLDNQLAQLFRRLGPATGPGRCEKSPSDSRERVAQSEIAARLDVYIDKLDEMINATANTIDCLEI